MSTVEGGVARIQEKANLPRGRDAKPRVSSEIARLPRMKAMKHRTKTLALVLALLAVLAVPASGASRVGQARRPERRSGPHRPRPHPAATSTIAAIPDRRPSRVPHARATRAHGAALRARSPTKVPVGCGRAPQRSRPRRSRRWCRSACTPTRQGPCQAERSPVRARPTTVAHRRQHPPRPWCRPSPPCRRRRLRVAAGSASTRAARRTPSTRC